MRRAQAHELNEDAVPAVVLEISKQRLRELFPVQFSPVDPLAEPEPSIAALVELASGRYCVVTYGLITHRATISFPATEDVSNLAMLLFRETGIQKNEVQWIADRARAALRAEATVVTRRMVAVRPAAGGRSVNTLRNKSKDELYARERDLRELLFKLRFQRATGDRQNSIKLREVRREIAAIQTLLDELAKETS